MIDFGHYAYDVSVLDQQGRLLHLPTGALVWEEQPDELSTAVTCVFPDVETTEGPMSSLVLPGTPFYLSLVERGGGTAPGTYTSTTSTGAAWDPVNETGRGTPGGFAGAPVGELVRGTVTKLSRASDGIALEVLVVDNLATLLKHDVDVHIEEGTTIQQALTDLFAKWGLQLGEVAWPSATLPEITARGQTAASVVDEILAAAPRQGAGQYTLRSRGETLDVVTPGGNATVFWLQPGAGAGQTRYSVDVTELVSSVQVVPAGDNKQSGQPKTLDGESGFNGATRFVVRDEKLTDEMAELEAQAALAEHGFPVFEFEHETFDVPQVRKWDRIRITDRIVDGYFIVVGCSHDASGQTMKLVLETPEDFERKGRQLALEAQLNQLKTEQAALEKEQKAIGGLQKRKGSAIDILRKTAAPVLGRPYVYGGPLGRSNFEANPAPGISTDCSGFVAWMYHRLGHKGLPAQTMSIYAQVGGSLTQVGSSNLSNAAPGDILLWNVVDPGNPSQAYGHVSIWLEGSQHLESGGNAGGIGISSMLSVPYLVLRSRIVYEGLHTGGNPNREVE